MIDAYERKRENRARITDKIAKLTGEEPWSGYDEQSADAITTALNDTDALTAQEVKTYERDHKDRTGVIENRQTHRPQLKRGRGSGSATPPRPTRSATRATVAHGVSPLDAR